VQGVLVLADGKVFHGHGFGAPGLAVGEICFNTAMTGYQEILTDPSYRGQIVTLTYPHIGNTGCNGEDAEGRGIFCSALVVRNRPRAPSSWRSEEGLEDYLRRHGIPAIAELDTRALTRHLREGGAQNAALMVGPDADPEKALAAARAFPGLEGADLIAEVATAQSQSWDQASGAPREGYRAQPRTNLPHHVVVYDFGAKRNILRLLADRGCRATLVPPQTPVAEVLALRPDGVLFSNGPGDPAVLHEARARMAAFLEHDLPLFGLCLGHQILGLTLGARSLKMKFGHHGANHPVQDLRSGRVLITSQNHGFAIDADTLPARVEVTHRSLFDGSLQGMRLRDRPVFSFQGHPEAGPGPHDAACIFDDFVASFRPSRETRIHG